VTEQEQKHVHVWHAAGHYGNVVVCECGKEAYVLQPVEEPK
jgi:hypothetical protein